MSTLKKIKLTDYDETQQKETVDEKDKSPKLPPETWEHIFRSLSTTDFLSIINTCMEWNQLLDSRKVKELFEMVFPHVLPYLNKKEIVALRLVNTNWQARVDLALQTIWTSSDHASIFPSGRTIHPHSNVEVISKRYLFGVRMIPRVEEFLIALKLQGRVPQARNPFLTRSLELDCQDWQHGEFKHRVEHLFLRYGHHIWRLKLTLDWSSSVPMLCTHLGRLPQLKFLEISGDIYGDEGPIYRSSLPCLSELTHLDVAGLLSNLLIQTCGELYGDQLSSLAVHDRWFRVTGKELIARNSLFPNLKTLRVDQASSDTMSTLSLTKWRLETLQLQLSSDWLKSTPHCSKMIAQTAAKFKGSLTTLELAYQLAGSQEEYRKLSKLAFKKRAKLETIVFWTEKGSELVKLVIKRNNFK